MKRLALVVLFMLLGIIALTYLAYAYWLYDNDDRIPILFAYVVLLISGLANLFAIKERFTTGHTPAYGAVTIAIGALGLVSLAVAAFLFSASTLLLSPGSLVSESCRRVVQAVQGEKAWQSAFEPASVYTFIFDGYNELRYAKHVSKDTNSHNCARVCMDFETIMAGMRRQANYDYLDHEVQWTAFKLAYLNDSYRRIDLGEEIFKHESTLLKMILPGASRLDRIPAAN